MVAEKNLKKIPSLGSFNIILNSLSHEDKISHLFTVDIKFHKNNPKTFLFGEICTPIFEKQKVVKAYERSVLQLLNVLSRNEENQHPSMIINNFQ